MSKVIPIVTIRVINKKLVMVNKKILNEDSNGVWTHDSDLTPAEKYFFKKYLMFDINIK